ncbi:MAG: PH domain-containing protein [Planctomycetota bacterium]
MTDIDPRSGESDSSSVSFRLRRQEGLDPGVIWLWRFTNALGFVVVGGAALAVSVILIVSSELPWVFTGIAAVWMVLLALAWWCIVEGPSRLFRGWSYRIDEKVVELRHGILWRSAVSIPISRLQHVDLHRGPFEKRIELATLEMHTAGTRHASHRIPGLREAVAESIRDHLVDAIGRVASERNSARAEFSGSKGVPAPSATAVGNGSGGEPSA